MHHIKSIFTVELKFIFEQIVAWVRSQIT